MPKRKCAARGCDYPLKRDSHVMCGMHWSMVPCKLQIDLLKKYKPGQGDPNGSAPSPGFTNLVKKAKTIVARRMKKGGQTDGK